MWWWARRIPQHIGVDFDGRPDVDSWLTTPPAGDLLQPPALNRNPMATIAQHATKTETKLSPGQLASETGMDRGFISRVLRGQRGITLDRAVDLAAAAGVTVDMLVKLIDRNRTAA